MNLQPVKSDFQILTLWCCKCGRPTKTPEVMADLDGKPGDYYCPSCAKKEAEK